MRNDVDHRPGARHVGQRLVGLMGVLAVWWTIALRKPRDVHGTTEA
ncbi:MAG: hypothetical protein WCR51_09360 [Planctomycetia bacterium]